MGCPSKSWNDAPPSASVHLPVLIPLMHLSRCSRQDLLDSILVPEKGGKESRKLKAFTQYAGTMARQRLKHGKEFLDVGVVYLLGKLIVKPCEGILLMVLNVNSQATSEMAANLVLRPLCED